MLVRKNLWNSGCLRKALAFSTLTLALPPVIRAGTRLQRKSAH